MLVSALDLHKMCLKTVPSVGIFRHSFLGVLLLKSAINYNNNNNTGTMFMMVYHHGIFIARVHLRQICTCILL